MLSKWIIFPAVNLAYSQDIQSQNDHEWEVSELSYVRITPWLLQVCNASCEKHLCWSPIWWPCRVWKKKFLFSFFLNLEKVSNQYIPWCTKSSYKGAVISHPKELYYLPIVHSEWLSPLWRFSYHEWLLHDKMWARVA